MELQSQSVGGKVTSVRTHKSPPVPPGIDGRTFSKALSFRASVSPFAHCRLLEPLCRGIQVKPFPPLAGRHAWRVGPSLSLEAPRDGPRHLLTPPKWRPLSLRIPPSVAGTRLDPQVLRVGTCVPVVITNERKGRGRRRVGAVAAENLVSLDPQGVRVLCSWEGNWAPRADSEWGAWRCRGQCVTSAGHRETPRESDPAPPGRT